jgi:hypothetical protein
MLHFVASKTELEQPAQVFEIPIDDKEILLRLQIRGDSCFIAKLLNRRKAAIHVELRTRMAAQMNKLPL